MIYTQCCGIVLMLVLFLFYKMQKRIHLNTEKAFWLAFCATILSLSMDIISVVAIRNMDILPQTLVEVLCKAYLVSLETVANFSVLYLCADIFHRGGKYKKTVVLCLSTLFASGTFTFVTPVSIYMDATGAQIYTYGPSTWVTYIYVALMIAMNLFLLFRYKARIHSRRRQAIFVWMAVWIMSALTQLLLPTLLIVGFASAIGIMILYLRLENPEINLDRKTGFFNRDALVDYIKQLHAKDQECAILSLIFDDSFYKSMKEDTEADLFLEVINYLSEIQDAYPFKYSDDEILLVFEDRKRAEEKMKVLEERFQTGWGEKQAVMFRPSWMFMPDTSFVHKVEDVFSLIQYVRENWRELAENDFVCVEKGIAAEMYKERETEKLIVDAIENHRVEVHYQPIFSTKERRFTSAEALVRIRDAQEKLVPPGVFIDIAEKNGMILKLGEIVFEEVCAMMKKNRLEQYGIEYVEINLSVVQCAYIYLAEDFIRIMEKHQVNPRMINLEITESASLSAKKTLLENMRCLMNYGVRFSLDDFGTGQSNLNYIVDMPVVIVKFDREMTKAYFENGKAKYVLDAAMHMIHGMNLEIVSEGVETEKQYNVMEALGINYIQGYYFSKPLPELEFLQFLEQECMKNHG